MSDVRQLEIDQVADAAAMTPERLAGRCREIWGSRYRHRWPVTAQGGPRRLASRSRRPELGEVAAYIGVPRETVEQIGLPWPEQHGRPLSWRLGRYLRGLRADGQITEADMADALGLPSWATARIQDGVVTLDRDGIDTWCEVAQARHDQAERVVAMWNEAQQVEGHRPVRPLAELGGSAAVADYYGMSRNHARAWLRRARRS